MATIQDRKHRRLEELTVNAARAFVESGLHGVEGEVVVALDTSPRMAPLYASGVVQELTAALLALAMKFDDDGVVPVWSFDDEARHLGEIRRTDYGGWVRKHVPTPVVVPLGEAIPAARFAPLIEAIGRRYFAREWGQKGTTRQTGERIKRAVVAYPGVSEPRECPVFVIVVTCGDCSDPGETTKLLRRASFLPIFWQFAGLVSPEGEPHEPASEFRFLRTIDKLQDTHCDGAGFFQPGDPAATDELYQGLLNEFPEWLQRPQVQAMVVPASERVAPDDGLDAVLMALPPTEAAKRERARSERERRRLERANMATLELEQAAAWPTIRTSSEIDSTEGEDPVIRSRGDGPPLRVQMGTRPYTTGDGDLPVLPPRRPTVSFAALVEPAPAAESDDEDTVETAIERLARIRARRNSRKPD